MSERSEQANPDERADERCPCGSGVTYAACCQPFHRGTARPETAEQLMRSRYSAYCLRLVNYLVDTTHPDKRGRDLGAQLESNVHQVNWRSLQIVSKSKGSRDDKVGKVEFIAEYSLGGETRQLHERSRFRRFQGAWHYFDDRG